MRRLFFRTISLIALFIFVLVQGQTNYVKALAVSIQEATTPDTAVTLQVGGTYTKAVKSGDELWFKVSPSALIEKNSHIKFQVNGVSYYLSIYNSLQNAKNGKTHSDYLNKSAAISYPISWEGPYYVKVKPSSAGTMSLQSQAVTTAPTVPTYEDELCSSEALAQKNTTIFGLLDTFRSFRDNVLQKTDFGKEITNAYYSASKQTVDDIIFNSDYRANLTTEVVKISGMLKELDKVSKGQSSSYVITQNDYNASQKVFEMISSKVDSDLKSRLTNIWNELDMKGSVGKNLQYFCSNAGLTNFKQANLELIVKTKSNTASSNTDHKIGSILAANNVNSSYKVKEVGNEVAKLDNTFVVKFPEGTDINSAKALLEKDPQISSVSVNYQFSAYTSDIDYNYEWDLQNTGQKIPVRDDSGSIVDVKGNAGSDIDFLKMKGYLSGKPLTKTIVAVVDTGVNYELADFKGVVDSTKGYDFVNKDADAMDDHFHGTHVAGIIGAKQDNGYGIAGINNSVTILPVKVLDSSGNGSTDTIALGIKYAVDKGAKVINLSLGVRKSDGTPVQPSEVPEIEEQLKYAQNKGVTVIAAAGNESKDNLSYPANSQYVINVGATDNKDQLANFSNYGKGLDMVAPGVSIPSLMANGEVAYLSGTSMAAPTVTAVAAMLYSLQPTITPANVRTIFHNNSKDLDKTGYDLKYGYGRLNAFNAVKAAIPVPITSITLPAAQTVYVGKAQKLNPNILPSTASNNDLTWSSSNTAVATVDSQGNVIGKTTGVTTIKALAKDGSNKYATCVVTVKKEVKVTSIVLPNVTTVYIGKPVTLAPKVFPSDSSNKAIKWSSSNTSVLSVDDNGKLTGKSVGIEVVKAEASDGSGKYTYTLVEIRR